MKYLACSTLLLAVAFNSVLQVCALPGFIGKLIKFGGDKTFDKAYENVNSKVYNLITSITTKKGKCVKQVTATGHGIGDVIDLPCSPNGVFSITSKRILIYGNPIEDSFFLFSDEPSFLTVFKDGKCTKRKYTIKKKKVFGEMLELSEEDCKTVESKIMFIQNEGKKFLDALDNQANGKSTQLSSETTHKGASGVKPQTQKASTTGATTNYKPFTDQPTSQNGLTVTELSPGSGSKSSTLLSSGNTGGTKVISQQVSQPVSSAQQTNYPFRSHYQPGRTITW